MSGQWSLFMHDVPQDLSVVKAQCSDVLQVVLFHAKHVLTTRDVCALLCSCTTAATVALLQFEGQLQLEFAPKTLQQIESFNSWMLRNGCLLGGLTFSPCMACQPDHMWRFRRHHWVPPSLQMRAVATAGLADSADELSLTLGGISHSLSQSCRITDDADQEDDAAAGTMLGEGLAAADAAGSLPNLRSFSCSNEVATVPALLMHLPSALTVLQLTWSSFISQCRAQQKQGPGAEVIHEEFLCEPLAIGLMRLKSLCSLLLHNTDTFTESRHYTQGDVLQLPPIAPEALGSLVKLTNLELSGFNVSRSVIARLPASLKRLMLSSWRNPIVWAHVLPRDLSALTAVTELSTGGEYNSLSRRIVYPPNVEYLHDNSPSARDTSLQPLTALRHLGGWAEAGLAVQLGRSATRLTHLALQIECSSFASSTGESIAAVFTPAEDGDGVIDISPVVDQLCQAGVAGAVREVWLCAEEWRAGVFDVAVAQQLCRLQNLSSLRVEIKLQGDGIAALGGLTGLSKLELSPTVGCGASKAVLLSLPTALAELPSLHSLQLPEALQTVRSKQRCALFEQLLQMTQLHELQLWGRLQASEQKKLAAMLAAAPHITEVSWQTRYYKVERHNPNL